MSEGFKVIETQEQFDAAIGERLRRERETIEKKYQDYVTLKDQVTEKQSRIEELEGQLEEAQKAGAGVDTKIKDLEAKVHKYETNSVKMRIAQEYGLDPKLAERLTGDDEESIKKDAEALKGIVGDTRMKKVPLKSTEPEGEGSDEALKNMLSKIKGEE